MTLFPFELLQKHVIKFQKTFLGQTVDPEIWNENRADKVLNKGHQKSTIFEKEVNFFMGNCTKSKINYIFVKVNFNLSQPNLKMMTKLSPLCYWEPKQLNLHHHNFHFIKYGYLKKMVDSWWPPM